MLHYLVNTLSWHSVLQNFPNKAMATCPFNAGHVVPEPEYRYHVSNCPDKHALELVAKRDGDSQSWTKGNTDVPTYFPEVPAFSDSGEDWDAELATSRIGVQARDIAGIGYSKSLAGLVYSYNCSVNCLVIVTASQL